MSRRRAIRKAIASAHGFDPPLQAHGCQAGCPGTGRSPFASLLHAKRVHFRVCLAILVALACAPAGYAWGGKTRLARRYRPGQQIVYQTTIKTHATVSSNPEGLKALLPPVPTELSTRQQNTVTVRAIGADGVAEVENRFDRFEFKSNLAEALPQDLRDAASETQEEFSKQLQGRTLTVRYDRLGRLLSTEGTEALFKELDLPMRETGRQMLQIFLEHMGGSALYPDRPVRQGEEWTQKLDAPASASSPFSVQGESTMRFVGKTRQAGVKAAIIDFRFSNLMKPSVESLRQAGPFAQLEAQGLKLEIHIEGQGEGRALVALDDGRILQNHATLRQTLRAEMPTPPALRLPVNGPLRVQVDSETKVEMESASRARR